jgi:hypothetical protein
MTSATLQRQTPIHQFKPFLEWKAPQPDRAAFARHQYETGVVEVIKVQCCGPDGKFIPSPDELVDDMILVSDWSEAMDASDPLAGMFRPGTRIEKETRRSLS